MFNWLQAVVTECRAAVGWAAFMIGAALERMAGRVLGGQDTPLGVLASSHGSDITPHMIPYRAARLRFPEMEPDDGPDVILGFVTGRNAEQIARDGGNHRVLSKPELAGTVQLFARMKIGGLRAESDLRSAVAVAHGVFLGDEVRVRQVVEQEIGKGWS